MAEDFDIHAWTALFIGLYALAAGVGELRAPNTWRAMLDDLERMPALRFLAGIVTLALGAAVYILNTASAAISEAGIWQSGDWLAIAVAVVGGVMIAEGALLLAAGDRLVRLGFKAVGRTGKAWVGFAALFGIAFILAAISRI